MIRVGLQLNSLRREMTTDLPGALAAVRALGVTDVETVNFHSLSPAKFAAALRTAGLRCRGVFFPYERFRDDAAGVVSDAQALGARFVVCGWMPHEGRLTREECLRAAEVYEQAGHVARRGDLRFVYHVHGFEFEPSTEGTLFDTLVAHTTADAVGFEVDVFWAAAGGVDPAALIERLAGRVPLTHLKDMARGLSFRPPTHDLPKTANAELGTGVLDFPAILAASERAGVEIHFIEDEHPEAHAHLPGSLAYLSSLRVTP
jgi:sugar phosphate isomerase/epimerase